MVSPCCFRDGRILGWGVGGVDARRLDLVGNPLLMASLLASAPSSPSRIVGMGVLLRVWRWCTYVVALTTLGDVASVDVVALPATLGGWLVPTLGSWLFANIVVRASKALACLHLRLARVGIVACIDWSNSAAAAMVRSASDTEGMLQGVGKVL